MKEFGYSKVVYQLFPKKVAGSKVFFEAFILGLKCHKTYFVENLRVAGSGVSCIHFLFVFEFVNRAEEI